MATSAHLEVVVTSTGVQSADKDLKALTATAKETEKQQEKLAAAAERAAERQARAAERAAERAQIAADRAMERAQIAAEKSAERAAAAADRKAAAAERAAERAAVQAEKAAARESQAAAKVAEQQQRIADRQAQVAERETARKAAQAAKQEQITARQVSRENEQWNDAIQKAHARNERKAQSAEKAAKREEEAWNNAIQRAKAGLDGVLPIRPRIEGLLHGVQQQISTLGRGGGSGGGVVGGLSLASIGQGVQSGAMSAAGMGFVAGGTAAIAAKGVESLYEAVKKLTGAVVDNLVEDNNMIARLNGVTASAEDAADTFEDLERQTFGKLPSTISEVSAAFVQLGNVGLQNSQSALKAYSNIAAQTGRSLGEVTQAVQMATMGNFRSLREYGVNVKTVGDQLQFTFRGQKETIADSASAIEAYLLRLGTVQFSGAVERQMDTIGGTIKKTGDAWERFINSVGDSRLGAMLETSVGAAIPILDAMTASVDALFGKIEKGQREIASAKQAREAEAALDKTMMAWADPTANAADTARLAEQIAENSQSSADKALARYTRIESAIARLEALGETRVGDMTVEQARAENERQYRREAGDTRTRKDKEVVLFSAQDEALMAYERRMREQTQRDQEAQKQKLIAVRAALAREEDAERASYEERKKFLQQATGPDTEALLAANEALWGEHLDKVAATAAKKQLDLQKRLAAIGVGPRSQVQQVNAKTAGAYYELGSALEENLSGKNGNTLRLEAEQIYKDKSIAIEQERAEEIAKINAELALRSVLNTEAMFGNLATAARNGLGEQSKVYKAMFAAQKGFGIGAASISMFQSMAEANKLPFPANLPAYALAASQGAQLLAQISALSYSGAYDRGGTIPSGSYGDVGERDWELVRGAQVRGPAQVIGREATAKMLGSQTMIVNVPNERAGRAYLRSRAGTRAILNMMREESTTIRRF